MAISYDSGTQTITLNSTAPAAVSTQDLLDTAAIPNNGNEIEITGRVVIESGATFTSDSVEGLVRCQGVTAESGGRLNVGSRTPDFSITYTTAGVVATGDARNDTGLSLVLSGDSAAATAPMDIQSGATIEWTGAVQAEGYILIQDGCTAIFHGTGSVFGVDTNASGAIAQGRIRGIQSIEFRGPGTFTAEASYRADFFADPTFTNGGAYSCQFTPRGAFQAISANLGGGSDLPGDFPNIANVGLINDFVGDAFAGKPMSLRNIATAKTYNVTHNQRGIGASNSAQPATLVYARADITYQDEAGNPVDTRVYTTDEGPTARTGSTVLPATITYRSPTNYWLNSTTVQAPQTDVRNQLNRTLRYDWLTETDGPNDIVTRVLSVGDSPGGNYTDETTGVVGSATETHYRFTTDTMDTMTLRSGAYGFLAAQEDMNTAGHPTANVIVSPLAADPVSTLHAVSRADASTLFTSGGIGTTDDILAVFEFAWQNSSAFMANVENVVGSHRKPWVGIDANGRVDLTDWNITLSSGGNGVVLDTVAMIATINGCNANISQGNAGITIGTNTLSTIGVNVGGDVDFINANSPGIGDVIIVIPQAWIDIPNAQYAIWNGTDFSAGSGALSTLVGNSVTIRGVGAGNSVTAALVHPAYVDVINTVTASATELVTQTLDSPQDNLVFSPDDQTSYDSGDTAASYFVVYTTLDNTLTYTQNMSPNAADTVDPDDGTFMAVHLAMNNDAIGARRLDGRRFNNVVHNFKSNVFGDRYAQVVARTGTSQVIASSQFEATTGPLISYAFSGAVQLEDDATVTQGGSAAGTTTVPSREGFTAPVVNYSIVQGAASAGAATQLDARGVTRNNIGNLGLLAPALDENGNVIPVTPPS